MRPILKQLVILLVIDALCGAGLWYGYTLTLDKKGEENSLRADLAAEKEKNAQLTAMQKMLLQAQERHQKLGKYLYSGSELDQIKFYSEIERLGRSVPGITLDIGTFDYAVGSNPPSFNVTVAMTGTYSAIYQALRLFEEFPSNISISRMEMKRPVGDSANQGQWSATLAFAMYGVTPGAK